MTVKPGLLPSVGPQRVWHDLATEKQHQEGVCSATNEIPTPVFILLFTRVNFFIWSLPIFLFLVSIWTHCWSLTPYSWWREPRRTFPGHNDSFLLHAFRTLSLPGSFLWCIESLLSLEFKGPKGKTLNQEEERQLKESHPSFSGTCWITSEADTQLLGCPQWDPSCPQR